MAWQFYDSSGALRTTDPAGRGVVYSATAPTRTDVIWIDTSDTPDSSVYVAHMYADVSGSPTHTSNGGWQKVGSGGGTLTWISEFDVRPAGVSAQVDTSVNKRIDIRKTGLYRVDWQVQFTTIADTKQIASAVYKNGVQASQVITNPGSTNAIDAQGTRVFSLANGDYLELYAYQADSASEAYSVGYQGGLRMGIEYLGPAS